MNTRRRLPVKLQRDLRIVLGYLTLETCGFANDGSLTPELRARIKLWIDSWIAPPIQEVLDWGQS